MPVSYYFDPNFYGTPNTLWTSIKNINFSAGAIVIVSSVLGSYQAEAFDADKSQCRSASLLLASPKD